MKKLLAICCCVILSGFLFGCEKAKFDHINAQNQYAWLIGVEYAPINQNIKSQIIIERSSKAFATIEKIQTDEIGRIISYVYSAPYPTDYFAEFSIDYNNLQMIYKIPLLNIDIESADFLPSHNGDFAKLIDTNNTMENVYNNGKITSNFSNLDSKLVFEEQFYWNADLINKINLLVADPIDSNYIKITYDYLYDDQGQLIEVNEVSIFVESQLEERKETLMTEFNQYGDWIKAEKTSEDGEKILISREIEYW